MDSANFMLTVDSKITLMNFYSNDSEKSNTINQSTPCTMHYNRREQIGWS